MYRVGQLDKRISIERDIGADDGAGGHTKTAVQVARVWAYIRNKSTRELLQGQQIQSTGALVVVIRNRSDVLPSDRIMFNGTRFNIVGVPPYDARAEFLEIECERGVAA